MAAMLILFVAYLLIALPVTASFAASKGDILPTGAEFWLACLVGGLWPLTFVVVGCILAWCVCMGGSE